MDEQTGAATCERELYTRYFILTTREPSSGSSFGQKKKLRSFEAGSGSGSPPSFTPGCSWRNSRPWAACVPSKRAQQPGPPTSGTPGSSLNCTSLDPIPALLKEGAPGGGWGRAPSRRSSDCSFPRTPRGSRSTAAEICFNFLSKRL